MPGAHPLRRRNRALPDEAAGYHRLGLCENRQTVRRGQVPPLGRTLPQPGQTEDRQCAYAVFQPVAGKHVDRGLDPRLARIRRDPGAHRLHHSGAGLARGPVAHRPRNRQGVAEDRAGIPAQGVARHPRGFTGVRRRTRGGGRSRGNARSCPSPAARRPTSISSPSISPRTPARARSTRCWGAISRSARSSIS